MYISKSDDEIPAGNPELRSIFSTYVGMTICFIGLVGNIISVLVWRRLNKKRHDSGKSAGIFLISLAITDSGLLIFFLLTESFQNIVTNVRYRYNYVLFYCYIGFPMFFFFIVASIWMVISITYNRFVAVVFPHRAASLNTIRKSYLIVISTLLFSFLINVPHFFSFHPQRQSPNSNSWIAGKTEFGKTDAAVKYDFWGHCMLLVLVPWLLISVLNSLIIYKLYKQRGIRAQSAKTKFSKEHQTTVILLTVSFTFLFFLIWQCITQCFYMLHFEAANKNTWFDISSAYAPARLGVVLNSAMNFMLYCLSGQMFRKEMYRMFAEFFGCDNNLVLLDTSTTVSRSIHRSSIRSIKSEEDVDAPDDLTTTS